MAREGDERAAIAAVSTLYEAALDETRWDEAMEAVRVFLGGSSTAFGYQRPDGTSFANRCPQTDPWWHEFFARHMMPHNFVWREAARRPPGTILVDRDLMPAAELERTVLFNEFVRPQRGRTSMTVRLPLAGSTAAIFSLGRHIGQSDFDADDARKLSLLLPSMARAVALSAHVGVATRHAMATAALDLLPDAVLCLSRACRIVYANAAAERLLKKPAEGLRTEAGILALPLSGESRTLHRLVAATCEGVRAFPSPAGGDLIVHDEAGRMTASLAVTPMAPRQGLNDRGETLAMVLWRPLRRAPLTDLAPRLVGLFGLTGREAELAAALLAVSSLPKAARALGIGFNTARTHLQRVFGKTETRSQNELIALLKMLESGAPPSAPPSAGVSGRAR